MKPILCKLFVADGMAYFFKYDLTDLMNATALFGSADRIIYRQQISVGIVHAHQCFGAGKSLLPCGIDGLKKYFYPVLRYGIVDFLDQIIFGIHVCCDRGIHGNKTLHSLFDFCPAAIAQQRKEVFLAGC